MNKKNLLWVLFALLLLGLIGFAIVMMNRAGQSASAPQTSSSASAILQTTASATTSAVTTSTQAEGFVVLNQFSVPWNGMQYLFIHRCLGEVKLGTGDSSMREYCVGDNQLSLRTEDGEESIIQSGFSQDVTNAPMLFGAESINVNSDAKGTVLLSYQPDPCAPPKGECGAGSAYNYVNFAYGLQDGSLQPLKNYPGTGWPTWNAGIGGTRAIFIPDTCGGAGCDLGPLTEYDLSTDTAQPLSSLGQAGGVEVRAEQLNAMDANSQSLPTWVNGSIHWKNDVDFTIQIRQPDGSLKTVAGKF